LGIIYLYVIAGLDGIGHVTISIEILVIGQTKVDFYCAPLMTVSGGIYTLHFMTGT
jgi:hypothetical protein